MGIPDIDEQEARPVSSDAGTNVAVVPALMLVESRGNPVDDVAAALLVASDLRLQLGDPCPQSVALVNLWEQVGRDHVIREEVKHRSRLLLRPLHNRDRSGSKIECDAVDRDVEVDCSQVPVVTPSVPTPRRPEDRSAIALANT